MQHPLIVFESGATDVSAYTQNRDLSKSDRLLIGHPQDAQPAKMRSQHPNAVIKPLKGNHQHQDALRYEPAVGVVEEEPLHAMVGDRPDL